MGQGLSEGRRSSEPQRDNAIAVTPTNTSVAGMTSWRVICSARWATRPAKATVRIVSDAATTETWATGAKLSAAKNAIWPTPPPIPANQNYGFRAVMLVRIRLSWPRTVAARV